MIFDKYVSEAEGQTFRIHSANSDNVTSVRGGCFAM